MNQIQSNLKIVSQVTKIDTEIVKPVSQEESNDNIKVQGEIVQEETVITPVEDNQVTELENEIQNLKKILGEKENSNKQQTNDFSKNYLELQSLLKMKDEEYKHLSNKLGFYKKMVYVLAAIIVVLIVVFFVSRSH